VAIFSVLFASCSDNYNEEWNSYNPAEYERPAPEKFYKGAMMTFTDFLQEHGGVKYYENGQEKDPWQSLKDHGANIVRLAVTVDVNYSMDPDADISIHDYLIDYSGWENVKKQLQHAKQVGLDVLLTFQLSSDNGETIPDSWHWAELSQDELGKQVYDFVYEKLDWAGQNNLMPVIVAIGNETNITFVWNDKYADPAVLGDPKYKGIDDPEKKAHGEKMLNKGFEAVDDINKKYGTQAKKLLHLHIIDYAATALDQWIATGLTNFDIVGLSWYANSSNGKHMGSWQSFAHFSNYVWMHHKKRFMLIEAAVPFCTGNFDNMENIAPFAQAGFPATPEGQRKYMERMCEDVANGGGLGVIYWGGEWVANDIYVYPDFKGSTWEDKAFWTSELGSEIHELHEGIDWMKRDYLKK
jgi:arabinogalactan endo-1,4-beta-galactosidase